MRFLHLLNAALYVANALVWGLYAHNTFMALVSLAAAVGAVVFAAQTDTYRR